MNRPFFIAVVDDDTHIRELVEACLRKEQYRTAGLATAEEALQLWRQDPPDLWVLDIMLPGMDGYAFCQLIRREAEVPIIMISARDHEVDKVLGLELGSDDYLTKPFSLRELSARIKRLLHRWYQVRESGAASAAHVTPAVQEGSASRLHPAIQTASAAHMQPPAQAGSAAVFQGALQHSLSSPRSAIQPASSRRLSLGPLSVLPEERLVLWQGKEVDLTVKEFELVHVFATHPNRAFTREELLTLVWGEDYFGSDRAVDHLVKRVRKKLADLPIEAVWGHGYRLRSHEEAEQLEAGIPD